MALRVFKAVMVAMLVFLSALEVQAFEFPGPNFNEHVLIVGFDVSKEVLSCKPMLKENLDFLSSVVSKSSLSQGNVRKVILFLFDRSILGKRSLRPRGVYTRSFFKKLSAEAEEAFVSLYNESVRGAEGNYSDFYGALKHAFQLAASEGKRVFIVMVSPGIQNFNRVVLLKSGRKLKVPENVEKVFIYARPFVCRQASETQKLMAREKYVVNYWKQMVENPEKLVFVSE